MKNDGLSLWVKRIVKEEGFAYYFSHETITKMENGELEFVDNKDRLLEPEYIGAGLHGMNGVLRVKIKQGEK